MYISEANYQLMAKTREMEKNRQKRPKKKQRL